ncbi:hypothetical protein FRB90_007526 [Tulasnella sp. 427]|nr:hypothetical protein FRB90_007526 [Tulasnella sp. 427]
MQNPQGTGRVPSDMVVVTPSTVPNTPVSRSPAPSEKAAAASEPKPHPNAGPKAHPNAGKARKPWANHKGPVTWWERFRRVKYYIC